MYHVLVTEVLGETGLERLAAAPDVRVDVKTGLSKEELLVAISLYDALIVRSGTRVDADLLAAGTHLRVVGRAGAGLDNIDLEVAEARGILVVNTPGANSVATAELTLALMLALSRHLIAAHTSLDAGKWQRDALLGEELYGKTLGIIGFGRVGRLVAERARSFGMELLVYNPGLQADTAAGYGAEAVALDSLLARADYITLHAALTPETKGMINGETIARMKDGAVLINVARGSLVDEDALRAALLSGKLRGAAVDVYAQEPPGPDHPLLGLENVLHTPHLGASTRQAQRNVAIEVVDQVLDGLRGGGQRPRPAPSS